MKRKVLLIFGLLAVIVALPLGLRRQSQTGSARGADETLIILTPQNETIRQEFGEAFAAFWKQRTGRCVYLDWRSPGGASEIRMVLDAGYKAAQETGRDGIGVDLLFGGGEPDFAEQARNGRLVPLTVFQVHPERFGPDGPISETFSGERFYPPDHVWVGTCLSQFGICYNPAVLKRLHLPAPTAWDDLGDPRYVGNIALSDPTKSGSVARSFELVVQAEIQHAIKTSASSRDTAIAAGWEAGLRLIQRMAANSRYFTDSASRIPQEIGQGNAAAGMCIDLYGRSFAADLTTRDGSPRLVWRPPLGGTTLSADPIGVLKGAPHPELAQAFVEFCLSSAGQALWFGKPGTPGGPRDRALHRLPIRRDLYTAAHLVNATQPDLHPYQGDELLAYDRELTGGAFNTLRKIVRVMCIDSHDEMKAAWQAMIDAGMPADALAVFANVSSLPYAAVGHGDPGLDHPDPLVAERRAAELGNGFRANYRKAEAMARQNQAVRR
jgi:ABC-type Fe3+ transport system substrate-binding protein